MDEKVQVFLWVAPEIQEMLVENEIDLIELLSHEGIETERAFARNPTDNLDIGLKEPTSVILASAALVLALTPILSRALDRLTQRKILVQEMVLIPVEDANSSIVKDSKGDPILYWTERSKLLESVPQVADRNELSIQGFGLKIRFNDSGKE